MLWSNSFIYYGKVVLFVMEMIPIFISNFVLYLTLSYSTFYITSPIIVPYYIYPTT